VTTTPDLFDTLKAKFAAERDPRDFLCRRCPSAPFAFIPSTGPQLLSWARAASNALERRRYSFGFVRGLGVEGKRRGWSFLIKSWSRERVAAIYPWALARLRELDEQERSK
jgi:hypothetical protein